MNKILYIDIQLVKFLLKKQGLDIKNLVKQTGISKYRLDKLLSGADQRKMKIDILRQLAIVLKVKSQSLLYKKYL